jgi:hypothetical protein
MNIDSKKGYNYIKFLLYLGVIVQLCGIIVSLIYVKDDYHFFSWVIPIFIRSVLLYYFIKRINIFSSLRWINGLILIFSSILVFIGGYNILDTPLYLQILISLFILLVLTFSSIESELSINDIKIVKKTNKTIYWVYIISFVVNSSFKKTFDKNKIDIISQNIVNQQIEVLDTIENSVITQSNELPKMIDDVTSFDSIKFYRSDNTISSYYTLKSMTILDVDINEFKKIVTKNISTGIKKDSNMMKMINDFNINYEFTYFDKEKSLLTRIETKNLVLK